MEKPCIEKLQNVRLSIHLIEAKRSTEDTKWKTRTILSYNSTRSNGHWHGFLCTYLICTLFTSILLIRVVRTILVCSSNCNFYKDTHNCYWVSYSICHDLNSEMHCPMRTLRIANERRTMGEYEPYRKYVNNTIMNWVDWREKFHFWLHKKKSELDISWYLLCNLSRI